MGTMGDIVGPALDPLEKFFDQHHAVGLLPRRRWIVKPEQKRKVPPGMEMWAELHHGLQEDQWQMLADFYQLLRKGVFLTKKPNWLEPPITATPAEVVNETAVAVQGSDTDIVTYTVPDRHIAVFLGFGHMLTVAAEWGTVIWNVKVNKNPLNTWQNFAFQRGTIVDPTRMAMPFVAPWKSTIAVTAKTSGNAVSAAARLSGYVFPVKMATQDGTYRDFSAP